MFQAYENIGLDEQQAIEGAAKTGRKPPSEIPLKRRFKGLPED